MNKRTLLSISTAALVAIPAPALAAIPTDPTQQEIEHGVQPTSSGYGDYTDTTAPAEPAPVEPAPAESVPSPAEQGVSTSPGGVEPVVTPRSGDAAPEATQADQGTESDDAPESSCSELEAASAHQETLSDIGLVVGNAIGGPIGDILRDEGVDALGERDRIDEQAREQGCDWAPPAPA